MVGLQAPTGGKAISFGAGARATTTALVLDEGLGQGAWRTILGRVLRLSDSSAWWIGDALAYGEWRYGEKYREVLEALELNYDRARDYAYVAGNVPPAVRVAELSFYHHRAVAKLVPREQEIWLARARDEGWSVKQLREQLAEQPEPAGHPAVLEQIRFTIDPDRLQRYTAAAERVDATVQDWALAVLDVAAAESA
jgi:hypothetical protein